MLQRRIERHHSKHDTCFIFIGPTLHQSTVSRLLIGVFRSSTKTESVVFRDLLIIDATHFIMETSRTPLKKIRSSKRRPSKKAKKESVEEQITTQGRDFFQQVQFQSTLAVLLLQMFTQIECSAIENIRNVLAEFRSVITEGIQSKMSDPTAPAPQYEKMADALSESWVVFQTDDRNNTFSTFFNTLTAVKEEEKSVPSSTSRIESVQSQSLQEEIAKIDSPSLYRLPESEPERITPRVINGRIAREDLDDDFEPLLITHHVLQ